MGFVIARVAREHGRSVQAVASDSYALTLWTYLQSEEAERLTSLTREHNRIQLADMIAVGFHEPKKLSRFDTAWRQRAIGITEVSRDDLAQRADDLWNQHERNKKLMH